MNFEAIIADYRAGHKVRAIAERRGVSEADVLELTRLVGLRPGYRRRQLRAAAIRT